MSILRVLSIWHCFEDGIVFFETACDQVKLFNMSIVSESMLFWYIEFRFGFRH